MSRFNCLLYVDKGKGFEDYFKSGHKWDSSSLLLFISGLSYGHPDWKFGIKFDEYDDLFIL